MTFCMNVSRFMNLAAIFSLDLESQFKQFTHYTNIPAMDLLDVLLPSQHECCGGAGAVCAHQAAAVLHLV